MVAVQGREGGAGQHMAPGHSLRFLGCPPLEGSRLPTEEGRRENREEKVRSTGALGCQKAQRTNITTNPEKGGLKQRSCWTDL